MISIKNLILRISSQSAFQNINWEIKKGENWLVTGPSGAGKSALLKILDGTLCGFTGTIAHNFGENENYGTFELKKHAAFVFFKDKQLAYKDFYYQQRYNSSDVEGTFTVRDFIFKGTEPHHQDFLKELSGKLKVEMLLDREFIKLSNGETRKVFIIKALLKNPQIIFLDNPYRGIDVQGCKVVNELINQIASEGIQVIMTGPVEESPSCITHALELKKAKITYQGAKQNYNPTLPDKIISHPQLPFVESQFRNFGIAFQFNSLSVRYGETVIINQLNWTVNEGEKWVLSGANGSGKSMLLSLVFADHPQAYANEIIIFGNTKSKGSSIWEIKEKIAYVSPEMHRYLDPNQTVEQVFTSALKENPYNKKPFTEWHRNASVKWLEYFKKEHLFTDKFGSLSTGEQNLVLFLRALVKNAPLLLLDEPFQDFDRKMVEKAKLLLDIYCKDRTLVMITHNPVEIPTTATHMARLSEGKIVDSLIIV